MTKEATPEGAQAAPVDEAELKDKPEVTDNDAGDEAAPAGGDAPPKPKGVQKRIDELTWRAKDAERTRDRALALLEQHSSTKTPPKDDPPPQTQGKPQPAQYQSYEEFLEALTDWKSDQKFKDWEGRQQQEKAKTTAQQVQKSFAQRMTEAASRYDDFDDVVRNPSLPITQAVVEAIQDSELGPDVAYFLGKNPEHALKLAQMSPTALAREVGRIEARIEAERKQSDSAPAPVPVPKAPPSAPPPPTTLKGSAAAVKDPEKMTADEWAVWRRDQLNKKRG